MFERYTEQARRIIFFAGYESFASGSEEINTIHLLLGLLREGSAIVHGLLRAGGSSIEELRSDLSSTQPGSVTQVSRSVDVPMSVQAKRVLTYAGEESDRLGQRNIASIHLLLALLRDRTTAAVLNAHGITRESLPAAATEPPGGS